VPRSKQLIVNRKESNQVFYSLRDPVLIEVLEILKRYFYAQLKQSSRMLKGLRLQQAGVKK
jgi:ArsR family transcriptional regulator